tara:strand:- start:2100 stop:2378 length:279 start_codon:yes stop_codon:yes gene_type:complete
MPTLIQYKIIDGFNEYNDYLIHKDDIDESDDENLIIDLIGGDRDEGDYRSIEVVYTKSIGIKDAEFLQECFIAFPYGGGEWLRQLATKKRSE